MLNELGKEILDINKANGWNVPVVEDWSLPSVAENMGMDQYRHIYESYRYKIPTSLALIHSEVSEALEEFRKDHRLREFGEELADTLIRTVELAVGLGVDLDGAVRRKLDKNKLRAHRHGGRLI